MGHYQYVELRTRPFFLSAAHGGYEVELQVRQVEGSFRRFRLIGPILERRCTGNPIQCGPAGVLLRKPSRDQDDRNANEELEFRREFIGDRRLRTGLRMRRDRIKGAKP